MMRTKKEKNRSVRNERFPGGSAKTRSSSHTPRLKEIYCLLRASSYLKIIRKGKKQK
jgi:hypothetical protein